MDTCGECKHINGVCLSVGFCDKKFCEVHTDRYACSDFKRSKPAKRAYVSPKTVNTPKPQPVIAEPKPVTKQQTITKRKRPHSLLSKLTAEDRLYLIRAYYNEPIADIQAKFGVSRMCLLRTLKALGVMVRKRGEVTKAGKERQMKGVKKHFAERRAQ